MADSIYLNGIKLAASCGVYDWEKQMPQQLLVSAELHTAFDKPAATDHLEDAVDYEALVQLMRDLVASKHFNLLEALADQMAKMLLQEFPAIQSVELAISKPQAVAEVDDSGVRVVRRR